MGSPWYLDGVSGNLVAGNLVGTNAAGTAAIANAGDGVFIASGPTDNTIGGTSLVRQPDLSGNAANGIVLYGAGTSGNLVVGDLIGTNAAGTGAIANGSDGVAIDTGDEQHHRWPDDHSGTGAGQPDSGNATGIDDSGGGGDLIAGNLVGANAAGTAALGNTSDGIVVVASGDTIGGTAAGARNVISGNDNYNVFAGRCQRRDRPGERCRYRRDRQFRPEHDHKGRHHGREQLERSDRRDRAGCRQCDSSGNTEFGVDLFGAGD